MQSYENTQYESYQRYLDRVLRLYERPAFDKHKGLYVDSRPHTRILFRGTSDIRTIGQKNFSAQYFTAGSDAEMHHD